MTQGAPGFVLTLLFVSILLTPTLASAGDWPSFLGPEGKGKSEERILLEWPAEGPEVLYFRQVGEGYGAPSIADGQVLIFDVELVEIVPS